MPACAGYGNYNLGAQQGCDVCALTKSDKTKAARYRVQGDRIKLMRKLRASIQRLRATLWAKQVFGDFKFRDIGTGGSQKLSTCGVRPKARLTAIRMSRLSSDAHCTRTGVEVSEHEEWYSDFPGR